MAWWTIAKKDLRLLVRDVRAEAYRQTGPAAAILDLGDGAFIQTACTRILWIQHDARRAIEWMRIQWRGTPHHRIAARHSPLQLAGRSRP